MTLELLILLILLITMATNSSPFIADYSTFKLDVDNFNLPQCTYVDINNISVISCNDSFSLLIFNIRSYRKNFLEFTCNFQSYFSFYSCIAFVETWLTQDFDNLFIIPEFQFYSTHRSNFGGGIRLYCRSDLNVKLLSDFTFVNVYFLSSCLLILCSGIYEQKFVV